MTMFQGAIALVPSLGPWFGAATLVAILLKAWQPFKMMAIGQAESHNERLIARVAKLEDDAGRFNERQATEREQHAALIQLMRHRLANMTMCLDALLMLLETAPERVGESVVRIKEMRARHEAMELTEKVAVTAAILNATGAPAPGYEPPPAG